MLETLGCPEQELSILLCNDQVIRKLNARFRGQDKITDVLAFPAQIGPGPTPEPLLGDVVISLQTAARQARAQGATLLQETAFLLCHGVLHLLGMDHDTPRKAGMMNRRTRQVLANLGLEPPMGALARAPVAAPRAHSATVRKSRPKVRSRRLRRHK
jgi:probable rRNA maturation factor